MTIMTLDLETTTRTKHKRKASPFDPSNWIVAAGWKKDQAEPTGVYFGRERPPVGWFKHQLDGQKILVGFNIKFDILHIIQDEENYRAYQSWVAKGGRIWDGQLAEYLLEGMVQSAHMVSLDEVAPRYGGNVKIDEVKALWAGGVSTEDIDKDLLMRYLLGGMDEDGIEQEGDIGNTERIFRGQLKRARSLGMLQKILLDMDALLFTIECEHNGVYVDKKTGLEHAEEIQDRLVDLSEELDKALPEDLPFTFNWGSYRQRSALLFGGTVNYDSVEFQQKDGTFSPEALLPTQAYAQKTETHYILADGGTMECSWYEHVWDTQWSGGVPEGKEVVRFKSGKNAGEPKTKRVQVDDCMKPKGRQCKAPYTFPGITEPQKSWEGSEPGVWSTAAEVIEELGDRDIPFLEALREHARLTKDLGTYYITTNPKTGEQSGLLTMVDEETGLVHHRLNHTSTVTGRLSSSDPNLQNVSDISISKVKELFLSRYPGGSIISSDFSSLEVYVQAILTGCENLLEDLHSGKDLHCMRLAAKENMAYDEVVRLSKGYGEGDKFVDALPEWHEKRRKAKIFSFQRAYGAGAETISTQGKIARKEVDALIAAEEARYPEIPLFYEKLTREIEDNSRHSGVVIPHPEYPGVMCYLRESSWQSPDGTVYKWRQGPAPDFLVDKGITAGFSPTQIKNYPIQGTGATWIKAAMALAIREFYRKGNFGDLALLTNQIHDALYVDAGPKVAPDAAALLDACMRAANYYVQHLFKWELPIHVPTSTEGGPSMASEEPLHDILDLSNEYLASIIERYTK